MLDFVAGSIHCNIGNIATFGKDGKDPLVTRDDDDSEKDDDTIKDDDNLVLVGHVEGDSSILEVFGLYTSNIRIGYNLLPEETRSITDISCFRNFN